LNHEDTRWARSARRGVLLLMPCSILVACGSVAGSSATHATSHTTPTPVVIPAPAATPPPGGPPPAQLIGDWARNTTHPNLAADLIFYGGSTTYQLQWANADSFGNVAVNGSEIDFYNADPCDIPLPGGVGRYQWSLSKGVLMFTPLDDDPCARGRVLSGQSYTKKT